MKNLLALLTICLATATAHAQWSKLAGTPKVSKLDFTIDSFRFRGEAVATQRYKDADLNTVIGKDAHENRVAQALKSLQPRLTYSQKALIKNEIFDMDGERKLIEEIKSQNTNFDPSLLEKECGFYEKMVARIKAEKATENNNREAAFQEQKRQQRSKDSTEKALAEIAEKERRATYDKELEASHAAKQKEEAARAAVLKKKYGAAAYAKAEAGKLWVGMPEELVEAALGTPTNVNSSTTAQGKQEEWLYYYNDNMLWSRRVFLRNHAVTSFQQRD